MVMISTRLVLIVNFPARLLYGSLIFTCLSTDEVLAEHQKDGTTPGVSATRKFLAARPSYEKDP
jgi:hypothetical protein